MKKALTGLSIGSVVMVAGIVWGYIDWADTRYANAKDHTSLTSRVSYNELELAYRAAVRTYEFLLQQHQKYPKDAAIETQMKAAERRLKELERKRLE